MPTRLLLVVVIAAIGGGAAAIERSPAGGRIDRLLRDLRSGDAAAVERAAKEQDRVAEEGLAPGEAERLLRAAPGSFAKRKLEIQSTPADLVRAAARRPAKALVPVVAEVFPKLPPRAQTAALELLMAVERRACVLGHLCASRRLQQRRGARRHPSRLPPGVRVRLRGAPECPLVSGLRDGLCTGVGRGGLEDVVRAGNRDALRELRLDEMR